MTQPENLRRPLLVRVFPNAAQRLTELTPDESVWEAADADLVADVMLPPLSASIR